VANCVCAIPNSLAYAQRIDRLPIHPSILLSLRESAKLHSTHYSTRIEGNRLTHEQAEQVVAPQHFPGRERDEAEVKGYYAAIHDYIVVDRDKLGIQCGRRQNHIIVCMRFLGKRVSGGR